MPVHDIRSQSAPKSTGAAAGTRSHSNEVSIDTQVSIQGVALTLPPSSLASPNTLDRMLEFLGQASTSSPLSKSVLAVALHLAEDEDTVFEDPHLRETRKCKMAYRFCSLVPLSLMRQAIEAALTSASTLHPIKRASTDCPLSRRARSRIRSRNLGSCKDTSRH